MVEELRGGIHILGAPFSGSESLVGKLRGRHFSGLEGAWLCLTNSGAALASWILHLASCTCRFHLFGSSEGGIFRFRGRSVVVAELKGDICILGRRFQVQSPWLGSAEGGIFQV